jgi:sensor histidine kinase regulating citrate/malate metabolism
MFHECHALHRASKRTQQTHPYPCDHSIAYYPERHAAAGHLQASENKALSEGFEAYEASGDISRLKTVMDRMYKHIHTDIFVAADSRKVVIYRANDPAVRGDFHDVKGMDEALAGKDALAVSVGPRGWAVRAIVPISSDKGVRGALTVGERIDDGFAKDILAETGAHVSFATDKVSRSSCRKNS